MGNCFKIFHKENDDFSYDPINNTCPICLQNFGDNDSIVLNCKHKLHLNCSLHLSKNIIYEDTEITCPICRNSVSEKNIKKSLKNVQLVDIPDPIEWSRKDIISLEKLSLNKLVFQSNKLFIKSKLYNIPFYLKISNLKNFKFSKHHIESTDYKYELSMCVQVNDTYYSKYIKKLNNLLPHCINLNYDLCYAKNFIFFVIDSVDNVQVTDIYDGEVCSCFVVKNNLNISIVVKPLIYQFQNKIYYVNKLVSVLYR